MATNDSDAALERPGIGLVRRLLYRQKKTSPTETTLARYFNAKFSPHYKYHEYWRARIADADANVPISNGWAFSTWSGLASFESSIIANRDWRRVYRDRSDSLVRIAEGVIQTSKNSLKGKFGGLIAYGYGNLKRESQLLQCLKDENDGHLGGARVYLLDCSVYYHLQASSSMNPMLRHIDQKYVVPILIDYEPLGEEQRRALNHIRDDLNPMCTVLHVFLGNTFGNLPASVLRQVLDTYTRPGDLIAAEYAQYSEDFFQDTSQDYVSEMARAATAELFACTPEQVSVRSEAIESEKYLKISVEENGGSSKPLARFTSMLRRQFEASELLTGRYQKILDPMQSIPHLTEVVVFQRL